MNTKSNYGFKWSVKGLDFIFSVYVAVLPILQYYKSPINSLNLATFLAVVFGLVFIFDIVYVNKGVVKLDVHDIWPILLYLLYVGFNVFFTIEKYNYSESQENILPFLRMVLLIFTIIVAGRRHFNGSIAMKTILRVMQFSLFFMIIQIAANNKLFIAELLTEPGYATMSIRPSGLYMEPAHLAQSSILLIMYLLFGDDENLSKKKKLYITINIIDIIISGSGIGYALLAVVFVIWFITGVAKGIYSNRQIIVRITAILVVAIIMPLLVRIPYISFAISRFTNTGSFGGTALVGRTGTNYMFANLPAEKQMFGAGLGHLADVTGAYYTNSLYSLLIQCGYLVLPFIAIIIAHAFFKGDAFVKGFLVVYVLLIFVSTVTAPMELCFYFSFIIYHINKKEIIRDKRGASI